MANKEEEYKKLRSYLNKSIRGKNTDAILKSLSVGPVHLINNIEAVNDSLYIVSAKQKYLDQKLSDRGVERPVQVGLSDEIFREIGIEVTNRTQIRDLILQLLRIMYGEVFTRAISSSLEFEPYYLEDGDNLIVSFDDDAPVEIIFKSEQFTNINFASAQEVADAITKNISKSGKTGAAFVKEENNSYKISLISNSDGPSSSIKVLGGKAQSVFKFSQIRPTSADSSTEWSLEVIPGGKIRAIWVGGSDPKLGKVSPGDYINLYTDSFDKKNNGTFIITNVKGGIQGDSYVEYENFNGINENNKTQGTNNAILFFYPKKLSLLSNLRYASPFQSSPRTLEIFIPATTRIVRRDRTGAAHIYQDNTPSPSGQTSPYSYDLTANFTISEIGTSTTETLDINSNSIIEVSDASKFPDGIGSVVIGLGTSHQEGPIQYVSRPSDKTIRINPSYKFKFKHPAGSDISLLSSNFPPNLDRIGKDYPFYLTDSIAGRIYVQDLIKQIAATGIVLIFYVIYPDDTGLGGWLKGENSEKYYIWGTEKDL
jgi:hypothetical protein